MIPPALSSFDAARLAELTGRFGRLRVAVLGDFFLDKYLETDPALGEPSLETGRTAHQVVAVRHAPGAAGTVVSNLTALGAKTTAIGFTGDDGEGWELRRDLTALDCDITHLHVAADRVTPTYLKPLDRSRPGLDGEHDRYDTKNRQPVPPRIVQALLASLEAAAPRVDAVVVMDQVTEEGSGALAAPLVEALAALAPRFPQTVFWVDSRNRIRRYRRVTVKVNQFELTGQENPPPGARVPEETVRREAEALAAQTGAPVFATLGERGVHVSGPGAETVPSVAVEGPVDPTGAGDSFTSGAVLALAAGASRPEAALLGNLVASVTVRQLATTGTARPADLIPALTLWRKQHA
ncbi:MAG: PfkB family carbohydrate kinase [Verrucomicrobiota bacterium]|jgi:bifunctional ADP-heptose synthase (sugar kinase/adenylyltransferase)|nr:PfkB family carbohydrate kinase [Verrucomicrobiota bacterium]